VSREAPYEEYAAELLDALRTCIDDVKARNGWQPQDTIRLIFHVFKDPKDAEAQAVKRLVESLTTEYAASLDGMAVIVAPQSRTYRHRPVLLVRDLADLRGPAAGSVELPIWLSWSGEDRHFDLGEPVSRAEMYRAVLREAVKPADLTEFLDRDTLVRMWPDLSWRLPGPVQAAWEDQHPLLRATGRRRGAFCAPPAAEPEARPQATGNQQARMSDPNVKIGLTET